MSDQEKQAAQAEVERLTERLRIAAQERADARIRAEKAEANLEALRERHEKMRAIIELWKMWRF